MGFRSGRRFASCLRGGGRGKFSVRRRCTGRLLVLFPKSNQAQVPGVSGKVRSHLSSTRRFLVPIRVTWARVEYQAINGLDEGVSNRTVGDLGAKG